MPIKGMSQLSAVLYFRIDILFILIDFELIKPGSKPAVGFPRGGKAWLTWIYSFWHGGLLQANGADKHASCAKPNC
jgi:hypothetical protein